MVGDTKMILKIPLLGWLSNQKIICAKCKKEIGYYVDSLNINDGMPFHDDCEVDYTSEKEGWIEYRENYKAVQNRYIRNNKEVKHEQ